jgi:hypothetical protein
MVWNSRDRTRSDDRDADAGTAGRTPRASEGSDEGLFPALVSLKKRRIAP